LLAEAEVVATAVAVALAVEVVEEELYIIHLKALDLELHIPCKSVVAVATELVELTVATEQIPILAM
jgi:hypothetical protein